MTETTRERALRLAEVLAHTKSILPDEIWADDTKNMIKAALAKLGAQVGEGS